MYIRTKHKVINLFVVYALHEMLQNNGDNVLANLQNPFLSNSLGDNGNFELQCGRSKQEVTKHLVDCFVNE